MDAYIETLTRSFHIVYDGAICERCAYTNPQCASYLKAPEKLECLCSQFVIKQLTVTTLDMALFLWLSDHFITIQQMYEAQLPCDPNMVIIITEFGNLFSVNGNSPRVFLLACKEAHHIHSTTRLPMMTFVTTFKTTMRESSGSTANCMRAALHAVRALEAHRCAVENAWEMDTQRFENIIQWMPREIMEMTAELLSYQ